MVIFLLKITFWNLRKPLFLHTHTHTHSTTPHPVSSASSEVSRANQTAKSHFLDAHLLRDLPFFFFFPPFLTDCHALLCTTATDGKSRHFLLSETLTPNSGQMWQAPFRGFDPWNRTRLAACFAPWRDSCHVAELRCRPEYHPMMHVHCNPNHIALPSPNPSSMLRALFRSSWGRNKAGCSLRQTRVMDSISRRRDGVVGWGDKASVGSEGGRGERWITVWQEEWNRRRGRLEPLGGRVRGAPRCWGHTSR